MQILSEATIILHVSIYNHLPFYFVFLMEGMEKTSQTFL